MGSEAWEERDYYVVVKKKYGSGNIWEWGWEMSG